MLRELPGHRRVLAVRPQQVRVGDKERQAARFARERGLQYLRLRRERVLGKRVAQQVGPRAEHREEATREDKIGLGDWARDLAAFADVLLVVVAIAKDKRADAKVVKWRGGAGEQALEDEVAARDDADWHQLGVAATAQVEELAALALHRTKAHREQPCDRIAAPPRRIGDDYDLFAHLLQLANGGDRTLVRCLTIVDDAELIEQQGVVIVGGL